MAETLKQKIIRMIVEAFQISEKDVARAEELQRKNGGGIDRALIELGLIKEEDVLLSLVKELRIPFINLKKYKISPELKTLIPEKVARQYKIIPLARLQNTMTVAIADPLNVFIVDDLKNITGKEIDVVMSTESDILHAIMEYYASTAENTVRDMTKSIAVEDFEIVSESEFRQQEDVPVDGAEEAPVIRMVNLIIKEALKQRASDIHIEPMAEGLRVRYRIDGILQDMMNIPKQNQNAVIVRIKIMSRLDITTTRKPQDGRFKMRFQDQEVDFRVSLLPTTFGQKVVLRILDKKNLSIGLDGLGFSKQAADLLKEGMYKPFGMLLVTGPTGSGKSTTLYSILNELNTVERHIITAEEPVEYLVDGLAQIEVRSEIGLTFASSLRAILRQSPDIVMVGEIRDTETADIAIKAALTGQLVLSTLHTNDAAGAVTRLVDMGVEPFLVASSLVMVVAQRLCRRICPHCREQIDIPRQALERLGNAVKPGMKFFHGKGCEACRSTGYRGRVGITEVLQIDEAVRDMLIRGETSDAIKEYARKKQGMLTLWEDIIRKFIAGETTLEEVYRVTSDV
ncbi:MAG TPA: ATPase, T2SS/T4P/T4SS family [Candidatus Bathyarchaeia archaeon]|nr:ATPase, T2SS/T4P/T4SS family [Candidatus Bathyarchaeia archaeon]